MTTIRRIGVLSSAKISAVISAFAGLLIGAIFSLASLVGFGLASASGEEGAVAMLFGLGAIVAMPIFYGIVGFVGGLLQAWIYNIAAGFIGGLEVELG